MSKKKSRSASPNAPSTADNQAVEGDYSRARNEMFARTHNPVTPWTIVRADNKRLARTNHIKDLLMRLHYDDKDDAALLVDPDIVLQYHDGYAQNGLLAR
ncbi:MAG: hypothetical protein WD270_14105 [Acetobacterales bacterium]